MFSNILVPAYMLILITFIVSFIHLFATLKISKPNQQWADGIPLMPYGSSPDNLKLIKNNIQNLFEMPVLFYVMTLFCFVQGLQNETLIILSWAYVMLRGIHSAVHIFTRHTMARGLIYVFSNLALLAMLLIMMRSIH
ncbi:MAPEG family protein [Porticoccaceae bacterium]|jgi:hypothetical protein|nr:MAPEG family protein [Porticoccaceae bacterium]MDB2634590.1 MAPEG family protein [Porticoccaceae bacterium]